MTLFTCPVIIPSGALAMLVNGGSAIQLTEVECRALLAASERWARANAELAASLGIELPATALPAVVPEPATTEPEPEVEVLQAQPKKKPSKPILTVKTDGHDTLVHYDLDAS